MDIKEELKNFDNYQDKVDYLYFEKEYAIKDIANELKLNLDVVYSMLMCGE
jgi:hypothetical protein